MSDIRLERVTKQWGSTSPAVDDVSFHAPAGEFVVLLGPSGCGKSTTLRLIAGLESVTGGRILMGDRDVMFEGETGYVQLQTAETRITLQGAISTDLHRYVKRGAEILSARLLTGSAGFRLDALAFRLQSLRVETGRHEHWTELLHERLEKIGAVFELLDEKYKALASRLG